ncbi:cytochrome P450 [Aliidongia dinghuensis]|uniref:Cytochrome P450 n=1 Tax=Aliidongia dinghuensis TaxID=1867774 RepID=A0A8J2YT25_9PROT|nr:cytochrome P450 [Aliidongia dinghuensis]GGF15910.1 cytochrome P450 [Aliidongia dinghuensis]
MAEEAHIIEQLRARIGTEGRTFWVAPDKFGVFDPQAVVEVNAKNFANRMLPDKLSDVVRRRSGTPVSWDSVRAAFLGRMRHLAGADGLAALYDEMARLIDERSGRTIDLTWAAQEIFSQSLIPTVTAGLRPADRRAVLRDQRMKLVKLLAAKPTDQSLAGRLREAWIQIVAGSAIRRELRARAMKRAARQSDLADAVVDLLPALGIDRAVDAVTTVLTAIAGPPGSVAACLLFELLRRPDWSARIGQELQAVELAQLWASPSRAAPLTYRFVKECLRMWSPPLLMTRPVRTKFSYGEAVLDLGQSYLLSPYLIHHDPTIWQDPERFDPDRWLASDEAAAAGYVPFGWAPRGCIGANLGLSQLILFCHLINTRYRVDPAAPDRAVMAFGAVAIPENFRGAITRRA